MSYYQNNQGQVPQQMSPQQELMVLQQELQQLTAQMAGLYGNTQAQYQIQQQITLRKARANQLTFELQSTPTQNPMYGQQPQGYGQQPQQQPWRQPNLQYGGGSNMMPGYTDPSASQPKMNPALFNAGAAPQQAVNESNFPHQPSGRYNRGRYEIPEVKTHHYQPPNPQQRQSPMVELVEAVPLPGFEIKPFVSDGVEVNKEIVGDTWYKWNLTSKKGVRPMEVLCKDGVVVVSLVSGKLSGNDKISLAFESAELGDPVILTNCIVYTESIVPKDVVDDYYKRLIINASSFSYIALKLEELNYESKDFIYKVNKHLTDKVNNALFSAGTGDGIDDFMLDIYDLENIIATEVNLDVKSKLETAMSNLLKSLEFDVTAEEFDFKPNNSGTNYKTISIIENTSILFIDSYQVYQTALDNQDFKKIPLLVTKASYGEMYDLLKSIFGNDDNYCSEKGTLLLLIKSNSDLIECNVSAITGGFVIN